MIDSKLINKIIDSNYSVFKAFDVVDGDITIKEYFQDVKNKKRS